MMPVIASANLVWSFNPRIFQIQVWIPLNWGVNIYPRFSTFLCPVKQTLNLMRCILLCVEIRILYMAVNTTLHIFPRRLQALFSKMYTPNILAFLFKQSLKQIDPRSKCDRRLLKKYVLNCSMHWNRSVTLFMTTRKEYVRL
jgi:hypothetical protein